MGENGVGGEREGMVKQVRGGVYYRLWIKGLIRGELEVVMETRFAEDPER